MPLVLDLNAPPPPQLPFRDDQPPVITLLGHPVVTIMQRAQYTDAGATAFDAVDGFVAVTVHGMSHVPSWAMTIWLAASESRGYLKCSTRQGLTVLGLR
jgi:hypothetical protein